MNAAEKYLQGLIDHHKTPSVCYRIFDKDNILYQFTGGFADVGKKRKVTNETTFNAFSVTKTFTALAILQLSEQGKLTIDQPAKYFFPSFPYSSAITIRQLLTHSAGLPNPIPLSWIHLANEHSSFDRNKFFTSIFLRHHKTKSGPNEKFSYSNLGYVLLGRIIESISELTYEQCITENIIKRLNIQSNDLDFSINDDNKHATGYIKQMSFSNLLLSLFIHKSKFMNNTEDKWKSFKNCYVNGPSYGGLIGTPNGFVRYIQELLRPNSRLISVEHQKLLFTENFTSYNKPTGMCMSWFKGVFNGKQYFAHAGGGGGYYCEIRIYPDLELGSVIMFNRTGMKDERFLDMVDESFVAKK